MKCGVDFIVSAMSLSSVFFHPLGFLYLIPDNFFLFTFQLLILSSAMYNLLLDTCIEFLILVTQFYSHRLFHRSSVYNF